MSRSYRKPYGYSNCVDSYGIRLDKKINKRILKTKNKKIINNLFYDPDYDISYKIGETNKDGLDPYYSNGDFKIRFFKPNKYEKFYCSYEKSLNYFYKLQRK